MSRLALLVLALVGTAFLGVAPAAAADMDCGDFATQAEAQAFFVAAGPGDPHLLDGDGDGVACESPAAPATTVTDPNGSGNSGPTRRDRAVVVHVTDGDTLKVRLSRGAEEYVRLIGIDTPEVHGSRECGGAEASRSMARLAPVGARVVLVSDPSQADRDRYDRRLRYVERSGRDVGKVQIASGHAQVYVYRNDPFRRTDAYRRVERRSARLGHGLWARCWR